MCRECSKPASPDDNTGSGVEAVVDDAAFEHPASWAVKTGKLVAAAPFVKTRTTDDGNTFFKDVHSLNSNAIRSAPYHDQSSCPHDLEVEGGPKHLCVWKGIAM